MKKYITIAALLAAGTACANAEETTYNPLVDGEWTSGNNKNQLSEEKPTIVDGTYQWRTNWGQGYSECLFDVSLNSTEDSLAFEYTITTSTTNDCVMTFAIAGEDCVIVTGMSYKAPLRYAVTDVLSNSYTFGTEANWGTVLTGINMNSATQANTSYIVGGNISWDTDLSQFVLDLTLGGESVIDTPIALGESVDFSKLVITTDGGHQGPSYATLSNMSIVTSLVPEPSAFGLLAGMGALALVASRRRRR